jgi:antitoxin MazE
MGIQKKKTTNKTWITIQFVYTNVSTDGRIHGMSITTSHISAWGNGLAFRLTKPMAKDAGVRDGTPVKVTVRPGRIVIETEDQPTLEQMLDSFDPNKHGGEAMADRARGGEAFADGQS